MSEPDRPPESAGYAQLQEKTRRDGEVSRGARFDRTATDITAIRELLERIAFNTAVTQMSFEEYREKVLYGTVNE